MMDVMFQQPEKFEALTPRWKAYLCFMMALPSLIMLVFLQGLANAWLAILVFHLVACTLLPSLSLSKIASSESVKTFLGSLLSFPTTLRFQLFFGSVSYFIIALLGIGAFHLLTRIGFLIPNVSSQASAVNVDNHEPSTRQLSLFLFLCYFCTVNPVVEEFFWRSFLVFFVRVHWAVANASYMAYHLVVTYVLTGSLLYVVLAGITVFLAGCGFTYINHRVGWVGATFVHAACDTVLAYALYQMYYPSQ
jgi:hypothetical protein